MGEHRAGAEGEEMGDELDEQKIKYFISKRIFSERIVVFT